MAIAYLFWLQAYRLKNRQSPNGKWYQGICGSGSGRFFCFFFFLLLPDIYFTIPVQYSNILISFCTGNTDRANLPAMARVDFSDLSFECCVFEGRRTLLMSLELSPSPPVVRMPMTSSAWVGIWTTESDGEAEIPRGVAYFRSAVARWRRRRAPWVP